MKRYLPIILIASLVSHPAFAREQIRAAGSSTVYPFITLAAEQFGQGGKFKTPIIEATGTGGGFKLFCEGAGEKTTDIANASRPITDSEKQLCEKNGVPAAEIIEVPIGYDGIVLAAKKGAPMLDLSKKDIFLALARELPGKDGKLIKNPYQRWNEINPKLPHYPINVYGPPPTSGTRDAFVELAMEKGCEAVPEFATFYPDEKARKKACHLIREDGRYVDSGEDDNIIVQKLVSNEQALGVLGYSFLEENAGKIQASKIEGVGPDADSIESGDYTVSRSLYVYVKKQHIGQIPGIPEFMEELVSENAIGPDGYVVLKGLLPLKEKERRALREKIKKLK